MYLIETIEDYFNSVGTGCPVSTDDIFNYAKSYYPDVNRAVFNEYMTRVCARNPLIKRYQRGVYYKTEETEEGYAEVKMDELLKKTYLGEGDNVIGYVTGPAYMYNMAFTNDFYDELEINVAEQNEFICNKSFIKYNENNITFIALEPMNCTRSNRNSFWNICINIQISRWSIKIQIQFSFFILVFLSISIESCKS